MTLKPEEICALIDSREQCPLDLAPLPVEVATLQTGDYSVRGLELFVAVERKSLSDLLCCCGRERERFDREIQRLRGYEVRALVVESSWSEIEAGNWRSELQPSHVIGSLLGWLCSGVPILMADNHARAGKLVAKLLFCAARRRHRENSQMTLAHEKTAPGRATRRGLESGIAPARVNHGGAT